MSYRFTILGCGSSGGVPRLGGQWGDCDPLEPKNIRRRCSLLVERDGPGGTTRVLIDTSPDMRAQLLDAGVGELDAVVYTHPHADHVHGIDDLRMIVFNMRKRLDVWADTPTAAALRQRFDYAFETPPGSAYPPICDLRHIRGEIIVNGPGGQIILTPFEVVHGTIPALGFRVAGMAYLPDVSDIPTHSWDVLHGLDIWIVDALRRTPHPSHSHLSQTLDWIARVKPAQAILTNMHIDLDYRALCAELPSGVTPAFDGCSVTLPS
jgi:phosphoribosyl 1,2-cyclic phosphate phosphodiesterase